MVNTRILTTRRRLGTSKHGHARRRRSAWPLLATVANSSNPERLGVPSLAWIYIATGGLLLLVIAYLLLGAQATQTSYQMDQLKAQNAQLQAEQDQLRYQDASLHTSAQVAHAAATAGLTHTNVPKYVAYEPVALDLTASIGPGRPAEPPLWQQALAAVIGSTARDAQAAAR